MFICDREKKIDLKEKKMRVSGGSLSREAVGGTTGATKTSMVSSKAYCGSTCVFKLLELLIVFHLILLDKYMLCLSGWVV